MKVQYADTVDCAKKVVQYEGIQGLYRGISLQLAYVATGNKYIEAQQSSLFHRESYKACYQWLRKGQAHHFWTWACLPTWWVFARPKLFNKSLRRSFCRCLCRLLKRALLKPSWNVEDQAAMCRSALNIVLFVIDSVFDESLINLMIQESTGL